MNAFMGLPRGKQAAKRQDCQGFAGVERVRRIPSPLLGLRAVGAANDSTFGETWDLGQSSIRPLVVACIIEIQLRLCLLGWGASLVPVRA